MYSGLNNPNKNKISWKIFFSRQISGSLSIDYAGFRRLAGNVLGIGEVGAFKEQMFNFAQMLIGIPMLKFSTFAPILPIPC
jgi:hypothetical protein